MLRVALEWRSGQPRDSIGACPHYGFVCRSFSELRSDETENTVAQDTGGKVFRNSNNLADAVKTAVDDSSAYYVLGYYLDRRCSMGSFMPSR